MYRLILLFLLSFIVLTEGFSQEECLPNGIFFSTQSEIDSFPSDYPNCTKIGGQVRIEENNITNLNGLNNLTHIGGSLIILTAYNLQSLEGLSNLDSIEGNLVLNINTSITNFSGLENLKYIGGRLEISNFDSLLDFTGLNNLISIGESLLIINNDALTSLTGLTNLITIGNRFSLGGNPQLLNLEGLNNVASIGGNLTIQFNQNLVNLSGLEGLTSIAGDIIIGHYPNGGGNNPSLTSLSGIDNINAQTIENLYISNNSSLSMCEVQSICNYLSSPNGIIEISNNVTGCNTQNEVDEACFVSVSKTNYYPDFLVYPNPAKNEITIPSNSSIRDLIIYNKLGQKILQYNTIANPIDISMIDPGLYIIEFVITKQKIRKKLIIKR